MQLRNENRPADEWTKFKIRIQSLKNELKFSKELVCSTQLKLSGEAAALKLDARIFEQFHRKRVTNIIPDQNCGPKDCEKIIESRILMLDTIKEKFLSDIKDCEKGLQKNKEKLTNQVTFIEELHLELESKISEVSEWEEGGKFSPIDLSSQGQSEEKLLQGEKFEEEARAFLKKIFKTVRENENGEAKNKELQNKIIYLEGQLKAVLIDQYVLKQILGDYINLEANCQKKSEKIKDLCEKISQSEGNFEDLKGQNLQLEEENQSLKNSLQGVRSQLRIQRNAEIPDLSEIFKKFDEKLNAQAIKLEESQKLLNFTQKMIQEKDTEIENLQGGYKNYTAEIDKLLLEKYIANENLELEQKLIQKDSKIADLEDRLRELQEQIQAKGVRLKIIKAPLGHHCSSQIDSPEAMNEIKGTSGQESVLNESLKIENMENNEEHCQAVDMRDMDLTEDEKMRRV